MQADPDLPSLYERTGNIIDVNTLLVNRAELRRMLPWWRQLLICWGNYKRVRRFRINL